MQVTIAALESIRGSSNGRTSAFGADYEGSNPSPRILFLLEAFSLFAQELVGIMMADPFHAVFKFFFVTALRNNI